MTSVIYLSYPLSEKTPLYGNGKGISLKPDQQQNKGDSCNTMAWSFPNHSGTHIDAPRHFNSNAESLTDYPPEFWVFSNVELIDISDSVVDCQLIEPEIFPEFKIENPDLLLIKTGYGKYRGADRYTVTPPGLSANVAKWLRHRYPSLRCIGMDLISVSSFSNRTEGRKAHHAFLEHAKPLLLVEDMDLSGLDAGIIFEQVTISPLMVQGADGSPCTIFANIE